MMYVVRVTIAVGIVRVWDVCTGRPCLWKWILRPYKKADILEGWHCGKLTCLSPNFKVAFMS